MYTIERTKERARKKNVQTRRRCHERKTTTEYEQIKREEQKRSERTWERAIREEKGNAAEESAMKQKREGKKKSPVKRDGRDAERCERVAVKAARKGQKKEVEKD